MYYEYECFLKVGIVHERGSTQMSENIVGKLARESSLILNSVEEGIYGIDPKGIIVFCNDSAAKILKYKKEDLIGQSAHDLLHYKDKNGIQHPRQECKIYLVLQDGKTRKEINDVFWASDHTAIPIEYTSTAIIDQHEILGAVIAFRDISDRKRAEALMHGQNDVLKMIAKSTALSSILNKVSHYVEDQSSAHLCMIYSFDQDRDLWNNLTETPLLSVKLLEEFRGLNKTTHLCKTTNDTQKQTWWEHLTIPFANKYSSCLITPIRSLKGKVLGILVSYFPSTLDVHTFDFQIAESYAGLSGLAIERKQQELAVQQLAYTDTLTGLGNRKYFQECLSRAIETIKNSDYQLAVLFLDLDQFKMVNDTYGHEIGDKVLKIVGKRLRKGIRKHDSLARLGGDEFTILLPKIRNNVEALEVANRILTIINKPISLSGKHIPLSTSIGISYYSGEEDDFLQLIKNADKAMYFVKKNGKNNLIEYTEMVKN